MIIDKVVKAAVTEFKKNLVDYCENPSEEDLTTTSAEQITQGIQAASAAASREAFRTFLEAKDELRDIIQVDGEAYRLKFSRSKSFLSLWGGLPSGPKATKKRGEDFLQERHGG